MQIKPLHRLLLILLLLGACAWVLSPLFRQVQPQVKRVLGMRAAPKIFYDRLAYAAEDIVDPTIRYDPAYVQIAYPGGDVPAKQGVCADVVIRAYRKVGVDLQVLVHEDMKRHFSAYPKRWGLRRTDRNIDHRRVFNLAAFFQRHGNTLSCTKRSEDYHPGDVVVWEVQNLGHIGIVSSQRNWTNTRYLIVHNIGAGQVLQDMLFDYPIIGHYRYGK